MDDSPETITNAVAAIGRIDAASTPLDVLCETTGMRYAVLARVTDTTWTACAVQAGIELGVRPVGQLPLGLRSVPAELP